MIFQLIKSKNALRFYLFFFLLFNIINLFLHFRFTLSVYGDEYFNFSNDLMERSPIYSSSIFLPSRIWIIEENIYENLEFRDWELIAYLKAKKIIKPKSILDKNCEIIKKKSKKIFNISILKGNKKTGYSSLNKTIYVISNSKNLSDKVLFYDCQSYLLIEFES